MKESFITKRFKYSYSGAWVYIILVNIFVFLLTEYANISYKGLSLTQVLGMSPSLVNKGWVWQLFTYMFVHGSFAHLFFNMLGLVFFGRMLEYFLGTREFLLFYLLCGFLCGLLSYALYSIIYLVHGGAPEVFVLSDTVFWFGTLTSFFGASGCVYAILFMCAVLFPTQRVLFFWCIPMKLPYAVLITAGIAVVSQVFGFNLGVAHLVHLSGFFVSFLYAIVRLRVDPIKIWKENL